MMIPPLSHSLYHTRCQMAILACQKEPIIRLIFSLIDGMIFASLSPLSLVHFAYLMKITLTPNYFHCVQCQSLSSMSQHLRLYIQASSNISIQFRLRYSTLFSTLTLMFLLEHPQAQVRLLCLSLLC